MKNLIKIKIKRIPPLIHSDKFPDLNFPLNLQPVWKKRISESLKGKLNLINYKMRKINSYLDKLSDFQKCSEVLKQIVNQIWSEKRHLNSKEHQIELQDIEKFQIKNNYDNGLNINDSLLSKEENYDWEIRVNTAENTKN